MKMSDMTNDQVTEFLVRVTDPISNIMDDEETQPLIDKIIGSRELPVARLIPELLPAIVTFAIKKHKTDLYEIVGAFDQKPTKDVGGMNFLATLNLIKDSIDKDFIDFFTSLSGQKKKRGGG